MKGSILLLHLCSLFKDIFWTFFEHLLTEQLQIWTINGGERQKENDTQQIARGGIDPGIAAIRTHPLDMGHLLYQLNYPGAPSLQFLSSLSQEVISLA